MATTTTEGKKSLRVPPQSIDSEKALLGSIMLRQDAINEIEDIISPLSFYAEKHKFIYEVILELYSKGEPLDIVSISEKLKSKKILENVGGRTYLSDVIESVPSSASARYYAEIVYSKHMLRRLIDASYHISELGHNESADIENILDEAEKRIFEVTNKNSKQTLIEMKDALNEAWDRLDKLHNSKDEMRGVPTGFKSLDNLLSGLQKSDLIILAARPSVGKTSLALDIARNAAITYKVPTLIFSLEMSQQQLTDRMMSAQSQVNAWELRTGRLKHEDDFGKIRDAMDVLSKAPIYIDHKPSNNIISMRSTARKLKSEKNLGLVVVDYLQLMAPTTTKANDNMVQQVTEISRSLKTLARELDVPVLALSQLSRKIEERGGTPKLSDLRDSGSIEQDADVVIFIHRPDRTNQESDRRQIAEILVEKHRNGPTGKVELFFDDKKTSFMDIEKSNYGDAELDNF